MKALWSVLTHMDKQALRAALFLLVMFGLVLAIVFLGREFLAVGQGQVAEALAPLRGSVWGLPAAIVIFTLAAFIGVPQWALIAAVVLVFGPVQGGIFAWVSTMCSAAITFWIGRYMGAERLARYGAALVDRIIAIIRRNGFMASFAVRFVPTGPFILVNMAAGVSQIKFAAFMAGTGLGIIAKISVVVLIAKGLLTGAEGKIAMLGFAGLTVTILAAMLLARRHLRAHIELDAKKPNL